MRAYSRSVALMAWGMCFLSFVAPCRSQDANEQRAIDYVSNLQQTFRKLIGNLTAYGDQTEFLLRIPGLPVDPKMDLSQDDARLAFYRVLDKRPIGDLSGQTSDEQISSIYREILYDTESTIPVDEAKLAQLTNELESVDAQVAAIRPTYRKYMMDFLNARFAYNTAIREQQDGTGNKGADITLRREVMRDYENAWNNLSEGKRTAYLDLNGRKDSLLFQLDKAAPFTYRRQVFQAWLETEGPPPVPRMLYYPPLPQWTEDSGFTKVAFSSEQLRKHSGTTRFNKKARGGWFIFKAKGEGNYSKEFSKEQLDSLSIEMEIKQVVLDHIWLDRSVFSSKTWKWKEGNHEPISYGKPNSEGVYEGRLPLLPVGLIIGRNIKINIKLDKDTASSISKAISSSGGGSFLGFNFGGSGDWSSTDKRQFGDVSETGFEIKAPTIIGYICEVLPKCPTVQED